MLSIMTAGVQIELLINPGREANCVSCSKFMKYRGGLEQPPGEVRQADFFIGIGRQRPKIRRFPSSGSCRIIFLADEIESRCDSKSNCAVVANHPSLSRHNQLTLV